MGILAEGGALMGGGGGAGGNGGGENTGAGDGADDGGDRGGGGGGRERSAAALGVYVGAVRAFGRRRGGLAGRPGWVACVPVAVATGRRGQGGVAGLATGAAAGVAELPARTQWVSAPRGWWYRLATMAAAAIILAAAGQRTHNLRRQAPQC